MPTVCSCGRGHETFGACMRAKRVSIGYCRSSFGFDATAERNKNRELDLYADARRQGIQPAGTQTYQTHAALEASDKTGQPFNAEVGPTILE